MQMEINSCYLKFPGYKGLSETGFNYYTFLVSFHIFVEKFLHIWSCWFTISFGFCVVFLQNRENHKFPSPTRELILSLIQKFQEGKKYASLGLETRLFSIKWGSSLSQEPYKSLCPSSVLVHHKFWNKDCLCQSLCWAPALVCSHPTMPDYCWLF